jgi:transposase
MMQVTTIGLDIAKTVYQVHGVDAGEQIVIRQRLARRRVLAFFEKLELITAIGALIVAPRNARKRGLSHGHLPPPARCAPADGVDPRVPQWHLRLSFQIAC